MKTPAYMNFSSRDFPVDFSVGRKLSTSKYRLVAFRLLLRGFWNQRKHLLQPKILARISWL
jgi:hypothetical protein